MRIFILRNKSLPHITTVFPRHDVYSLTKPSGREFSLLPDGNISGFGGENHILPRANKVFQRLVIIFIITGPVQVEPHQSFIRGFMSRPAKSNISFLSSLG